MTIEKYLQDKIDAKEITDREKEEILNYLDIINNEKSFGVSITRDAIICYFLIHYFKKTFFLEKTGRELEEELSKITDFNKDCLPSILNELIENRILLFKADKYYLSSDCTLGIARDLKLKEIAKSKPINMIKINKIRELCRYINENKLIINIEEELDNLISILDSVIDVEKDNLIFQYIYDTLKKNDLLIVGKDMAKTHLICYFTELFYRLFYRKHLFKGHFSIYNVLKNELLLDNITISEADNELPEVDKQLIEPCLKKIIVEKSLKELQDIFTGDNKEFSLQGYKKTVESINFINKAYIDDKLIDEDVILLKEYAYLFCIKTT